MARWFSVIFLRFAGDNEEGQRREKEGGGARTEDKG
jgi:hypothetical protein